MHNEQILIPIPALFSFRECLWFLNRNYDDCLHVIRDNAIYKAIEIDQEIVLVKISEDGAFLEVFILVGNVSPNGKDFLVKYVLEWFDMSRSIQPFYDLLQLDGRLAYMTEAFKGLRLIGIDNLFEAICWCIIGQQINLSFAYKLKRRIVESFGSSIEYQEKSYYVFPKADVLANASKDVLKSMQFSDKKAEYIIGIARAFANGTLSKDYIQALPDFAARKKALTDHKGIGVWTANYALMKSLKEPEGIPHGDIGLLNALSGHNIIQDRSEIAKIEGLFNAFKGWESYLVFYLWRSLAVKELV